MCHEVKWLSRVRLFATPWTVAYQTPLSMGFSRQEYWSGVPLPSPGDLPSPGIKPRSPVLEADALSSEPPGKPLVSAIDLLLCCRHVNCLLATLELGLLYGLPWILKKKKKNYFLENLAQLRLSKKDKGPEWFNFRPSVVILFMIIAFDYSVH